MKKIVTLIALILFSSLTFAQGFKEKREKIKALKVAYITEKLSLTSDEAQSFGLFTTLLMIKSSKFVTVKCVKLLSK